MPDIFSSTNDGWIFKSSTVSWSDVRDASTGTSVGRTSTNNFRGVASEQFSGRFGAQFIVVRSFFEFDTSGISVTPADATLKIYLDNSVGIGEHPQHIDEADKLIEKIAHAEEKLQILKEFEDG